MANPPLLADGSPEEDAQPENPYITTFAGSFSIQDWLGPVPMGAYSHWQHYAMDYLIEQGHITVNPTSTIRLNEQGLWAADGTDPAPMESKNLPLFFPGTIAAARMATESASPGNRGVWSGEKGQRTSCGEAQCFQHLVMLLDGMPSISNAVWTVLKEKLKTTTTPQWNNERLKLELETALEEEEHDWNLFTACRECCKHPNTCTQIEYEGMAKLLYKLMGIVIGTKDHVDFLRRPSAFHDEAELRDPDLASEITTFMTFFRQLRIIEQNHPPWNRDLANYWDGLGQSLKKGRLGPMMLPFFELL